MEAMQKFRLGGYVYRFLQAALWQLNLLLPSTETGQVGQEKSSRFFRFVFAMVTSRTKKAKNAILLFSLQPEWWYEEFQNGLKTPLNKSLVFRLLLVEIEAWVIEASLQHSRSTPANNYDETTLSSSTWNQKATKLKSGKSSEPNLHCGVPCVFFPRCSCWTVLPFKPTRSPSNQLFAIAMFGISCWRFQFLRYQQLGIVKNYMCFFSSPRFWGRYLMNQRNVSSVLARDRNNSCRISWKLRVFFLGHASVSGLPGMRPGGPRCWAVEPCIQNERFFLQKISVMVSNSCYFMLFHP